MDYQIKRLPEVSGQAETENRRYHKIVDNSGHIWLYADQPNAGDNIYVCNPHEINSQGFGGSTLEFWLVDGSKIKLRGPWHSNSSSLFLRTGIDLRNKHYTRCVIGLDYLSNRTLNGIIKDVFHMENKYIIGEHSRGEKLAREFANQKGCKVYRYCESMGGSSAGFVNPGE